MEVLSSTRLIATATGLLFTGSLVGLSWCLTYITVPALLVSAPDPRKPNAKPSSSLHPVTASDHLARQHQRLYDIGTIAGPASAVAAASAFEYARRQLPAKAMTASRLYIAAALLSLSIAPFTAIFMKKANDELHRRSAVASAGRDESEGRKDAKAGTVQSYNTPELLQWWGFLNALRGWLEVGAFACATAALVV